MDRADMPYAYNSMLIQARDIVVFLVFEPCSKLTGWIQKMESKPPRWW